MPDHPTNFVVIGLGNFGSTVARELKRFDNYVIGIDLDEKRVAAHAELLDQALIVDARSDEALREAGADQCGAGVVSMGGNLEASVLATMNLNLIGVQKIWCKAVSKTHHRILSHIGAERVIHPEVRVGEQVAQMLHNPLIRDYLSLGNTYHAISLKMPDGLEGKCLSDLKLRDFGLRCLGVMRGTEYIARDGDTCDLKEDDILLVLGRRKDLSKFAQSIQ
jgi:trk system potassium uptake protein